ncbi:MAG: tetratricopeptide repeat protein [Rhodospirillales bacterium]|jgi:lipopolysaccharide biosynthesis regulator YciM|nr:tetratricopeptide repeat protein [Rhodospirillales bacterium]
MKFPFVLILAGSLVLTAPLAFAAGSGSDNGGSSGGTTTTKVDPDYAAGRKASDAKDWARAIPLLQKAVATDPKNANAYNLLGYSLRHVGKIDAALDSYDKALAINPKHKGAHEYIGEAYLQMGNVGKAEEHLKALDRICFFGCEEFTELKEKIAAFKAKTKG